jgi:hypothetical protein
MRELLIALMVLPPAFMIIAMLAMYMQLRRFQRRVPTLRGPEDLARFQRLAAIQMTVAISEPVLFWLPWIVWPIGHFFIGELTWLDLLVFGVLPFCVLATVAFSTIGAARVVRATPAATTSSASGSTIGCRGSSRLSFPPPATDQCSRNIASVHLKR